MAPVARAIVISKKTVYTVKQESQILRRFYFSQANFLFFDQSFKKMIFQVLFQVIQIFKPDDEFTHRRKRCSTDDAQSQLKLYSIA